MGPRRDLDERVNPEADPGEFLAALLNVDPDSDPTDTLDEEEDEDEELQPED